MKKKLLGTSWLIALVAIITFLISSIAIVLSYRDRNMEEKLKGHLSSISSVYDGTNVEEVKEAVRRININLKITIIDFNDNVIYDSNKYNEFTTNLDRYEILNLGKIYKRTEDASNRNILYIAGRDSNNYLVLSSPVPSASSIVTDLVLVSLGIFVVIMFLSYFFLDYVNKKSFIPLNQEVQKLAKFASDDSFYMKDDINSLASKISNITSTLDLHINNIIDDKEKMEFVVSSMNQGILVLDDSGKIVLINDYAANVFNNPKDDVNKAFLNKHYLYLIRNLSLENYIEETIENGVSAIVDVKMDNNIYLVNIYPSRNKWTVRKGNRNGAALLILDVTERRNLEHMKRDFFANASHELKSPLTTILGYQQMVSEAMLTKPEEIDDAVKRTIKEAKRMDKILGEMLELSRLESKYEVVIEDINLKNVVEDIIDSYNIELNEKKINVIVNVENCLVRINQSHCNQLINNLIDNAIKYNNPGGKLEITLKDNYLIIKDSGIGIAKADQIRIFERFYRVDKGRSKELGGTGLGLAIVKHICSLYSIIINLKSELYKGTEFKLTFPKNK